MKKRLFALMLGVLLLIAASPLASLAAAEQEDNLILLPPDAASINESWLKYTFPKLRSMETTETRFIFASAPKVVKTRAVLNKKGETLTIYRFGTQKDVEKCKAMIKGNTLVYGGKTVYVDTLFPATYYAAGNVIALYCGADTAVDKKLKETFEVAGGYGGYFDARYEITSSDGFTAASPSKLDEATPNSLKTLLKKTDNIYLVKVKKVPTWERTRNSFDYSFGEYELEVMETLRGQVCASLKLHDWPGVLHAGRSYVLFGKHFVVKEGESSILYADMVYHSIFEIDDRGYVLPIREYGMKAPVKLAAFLKKL